MDAAGLIIAGDSFLVSIAAEAGWRRLRHNRRKHRSPRGIIRKLFSLYLFDGGTLALLFGEVPLGGKEHCCIPIARTRSLSSSLPGEQGIFIEEA